MLTNRGSKRLVQFSGTEINQTNQCMALSSLQLNALTICFTRFMEK